MIARRSFGCHKASIQSSLKTKDLYALEVAPVLQSSYPHVLLSLQACTRYVRIAQRIAIPPPQKHLIYHEEPSHTFPRMLLLWFSRC